MLFFVLTCKDGEAHEELVKDAAEGPHVDGRRIPNTHHNLRGAVEARLDVGVELVRLIGATAKVNHLDSTLVALS